MLAPLCLGELQVAPEPKAPGSAGAGLPGIGGGAGGDPFTAPFPPPSSAWWDGVLTVTLATGGAATPTTLSAAPTPNLRGGVVMPGVRTAYPVDGAGEGAAASGGEGGAGDGPPSSPKSDMLLEARVVCPGIPTGGPLYRWALATQHHVDLSLAAPTHGREGKGEEDDDGSGRDVVVRTYTPVSCGVDADTGALAFTIAVSGDGCTTRCAVCSVQCAGHAQ